MSNPIDTTDYTNIPHPMDTEHAKFLGMRPVAGDDELFASFKLDFEL